LVIKVPAHSRFHNTKAPGLNEFDSISERVDEVARQVVDAAFRVHSTLGPGLLESVYEACLCHELTKRKLAFRRQVWLPVVYDDLQLDAGLRIDVMVEDCVIVELKVAERMIPLYDAQLLTYLKLTGIRLGLLINFNVPLIKDGIRRIAR
jgi:GxxExxY protein